MTTPAANLSNIYWVPPRMSDLGWYNCGMLFRLTLVWFALVALLQSAFIYVFMLNNTLPGSDFACRTDQSPIPKNSATGINSKAPNFKK